ncbi:MAG: cation diffusion facilitator family transporter [Bacillota bacterium]
MKFLATNLAQKIIANRDLYKPAERHRVGLIVSWTSIGSNLFLTLLKVVFGLLTNSIALIADAVHSISDILSSLVVFLGFSLAKKKPDREHPHGHGRTEYLAGLVIALMLIGLSGTLIHNAYTRYFENVLFTPSVPAIIAIITVILIKEFLYFFSTHLGNLIKSDTIAGDAWHHRSDSLSSALALVALIGGYFGLYQLDAIFGFAIALLILYVGLKIARNSSSRLLGAAPNKELEEKVVNSAKEVEGVINAHNLEIHDYGSWKVITMHIEVSGNLSLDKAHQMAHQVEDHISKECHCETIVHLDPS